MTRKSELLKAIVLAIPFTGILAGCATSSEPCSSASPASSVVGGIDDTKRFRRDWRELHDHLTALEEAAERRDDQAWKVSAASLGKAMWELTRYAPRYGGRSCEAVGAYATEVVTIAANLKENDAEFSWTRASDVTQQVRQLSTSLRAALPEWWFLSNHRHGRKMHRGT